MSTQQFKKDAGELLSELEQMFAHDDMKAISIAVVRRNGDVRHLVVNDSGAKIELIGATAIAHAAALELVRGAGVTRWTASEQPNVDG